MGSSGVLSVLVECEHAWRFYARSMQQHFALVAVCLSDKQEVHILGYYSGQAVMLHENQGMD